MATMFTATALCVIICALAHRANARFRSEERLPMQWWLTGEATWFAPRRLALALIPGLAVGVLGAFAITSLTLQPRAGQEGDVFPTLIAIGTMFIAVQLAHFWLIARTCRRRMG